MWYKYVLCRLHMFYYIHRLGTKIPADRVQCVYKQEHIFKKCGHPSYCDAIKRDLFLIFETRL